ncbi:hypothetical protein GEMRC1_001332 [Eukaryota sp. GEM-RC1]
MVDRSELYKHHADPNVHILYPFSHAPNPEGGVLNTEDYDFYAEFKAMAAEQTARVRSLNPTDTAAFFSTLRQHYKLREPNNELARTRITDQFVNLHQRWSQVSSADILSIQERTKDTILPFGFEADGMHDPFTQRHTPWMTVRQRKRKLITEFDSGATAFKFDIDQCVDEGNGINTVGGVYIQLGLKVQKPSKLPLAGANSKNIWSHIEELSINYDGIGNNDAIRFPDISLRRFMHDMDAEDRAKITKIMDHTQISTSGELISGEYLEEYLAANSVSPNETQNLPEYKNYDYVVFNDATPQVVDISIRLPIPVCMKDFLHNQRAIKLLFKFNARSACRLVQINSIKLSKMISMIDSTRYIDSESNPAIYSLTEEFPNDYNKDAGLFEAFKHYSLYHFPAEPHVNINTNGHYTFEENVNHQAYIPDDHEIRKLVVDGFYDPWMITTYRYLTPSSVGIDSQASWVVWQTFSMYRLQGMISTVSPFNAHANTLYSQHVDTLNIPHKTYMTHYHVDNVTLSRNTEQVKSTHLNNMYISINDRLNSDKFTGMYLDISFDLNKETKDDITMVKYKMIDPKILPNLDPNMKAIYRKYYPQKYILSLDSRVNFGADNSNMPSVNMLPSFNLNYVDRSQRFVTTYMDLLKDSFTAIRDRMMWLGFTNGEYSFSNTKRYKWNEAVARKDLNYMYEEMVEVFNRRYEYKPREMNKSFLQHSIFEGSQHKVHGGSAHIDNYGFIAHFHDDAKEFLATIIDIAQTLYEEQSNPFVINIIPTLMEEKLIYVNKQ